MKNKMKLLVTLAWLAIIITLAIGGIEAFLRKSGHYSTWPEKLPKGTYVSEYTPRNGGDPNYRFAPNRIDTLQYPSDRFTDVRVTNSLGFCDTKVPKFSKDSNEVWIAFGGDSYARGFGGSSVKNSLSFLYEKNSMNLCGQMVTPSLLCGYSILV